MRDIPRDKLEKMSNLDNSFATADLNQSIEMQIGTPLKTPEEIEFEQNAAEYEEMLGYLKELQAETMAMKADYDRKVIFNQ